MLAIVLAGAGSRVAHASSAAPDGAAGVSSPAGSTPPGEAIASGATTARPAPGGAASASFAAAPGPSGFTLRRVPNPRYRPPAPLPPRLGVGTVGPLQAIDYVRVHYSRRGAG